MPDFKDKANDVDYRGNNKLVTGSLRIRIS